MGCGCGGRKKVLTASGGSREIVYQVLALNGSVDSEYPNRSDAMAAASRVPGARVRTITRVK